MKERPLTLGTAGHIDHGKTTLVKTLTGRDTDRLKEEKERGISIELGFAELALPSGRHLSVVDVPGHERFVKTMVAGATGIDLPKEPGRQAVSLVCRAGIASPVHITPTSRTP